MESLGWEYVSNVSQKLFLALWSLFVSVFSPHGTEPGWPLRGEKWWAAATADRWSCWYVFSALLHKQISPVIYQRGKREEGVSSSATAVVWMIERSDVVPVMNEMVGKAGKGEGGWYGSAWHVNHKIIERRGNMSQLGHTLMSQLGHALMSQLGFPLSFCCIFQNYISQSSPVSFVFPFSLPLDTRRVEQCKYSLLRCFVDQAQQWKAVDY